MPAQSPVQYDIPRLDSPMVNPDGTLQQQWVYLLQKLWKATGGSTPVNLLNYLIANAFGGFDIYNVSTGQKVGTIFKPGQYVAIPGDANVGLSAAETYGAATVVVNMTGQLTANRILQLPTAAALAALTQTTIQPWVLRVVNSSQVGNFTWTLSGGTGVVVIGSAIIWQQSFSEWLVTPDGAGGFGLQNLGTG